MEAVLEHDIISTLDQSEVSVVYEISLLAEKLYTKILLEEVFTLFLSNKICGGAEFSKRYKKFSLT